MGITLQFSTIQYHPNMLEEGPDSGSVAKGMYRLFTSAVKAISLIPPKTATGLIRRKVLITRYQGAVEASHDRISLAA